MAVKKAFTAVLRGKDYQKPLLESIDQIEKYSDRLIDEARKSHVAKTKEALDAILSGKARHGLA